MKPRRSCDVVGAQNSQVDLWACVLTDGGLRVTAYQKKDATAPFVMQSDDTHDIGFFQPLQFSSDVRYSAFFATVDVKNRLHIWSPCVGGVEMA